MPRQAAFTIVEILVVISIVACLAALTFVAMAPAREQSRQSVCMNNLKQIYGAWALYSADWPGQTFPNTEMAHVPSLTPIKQLLGDSRILFCPDYNPHLTGKLGSSYDWRPLANVWQSADPFSKALLDELDALGSSAPALICHDHDWSFYGPRESEVPLTLAKAFEIHLLFSGTVVRGRLRDRISPPY